MAISVLSASTPSIWLSRRAASASFASNWAMVWASFGPIEASSVLSSLFSAWRPDISSSKSESASMLTRSASSKRLSKDWISACATWRFSANWVAFCIPATPSPALVFRRTAISVSKFSISSLSLAFSSSESFIFWSCKAMESASSAFKLSTSRLACSASSKLSLRIRIVPSAS